MARCTVEMLGKDGKLHVETVLDAPSVFAAAAEVLQYRGWADLWWLADDKLMTVRQGDRKWVVHTHRISRWYREQPTKRRL